VKAITTAAWAGDAWCRQEHTSEKTLEVGALKTLSRLFVRKTLVKPGFGPKGAKIVRRIEIVRRATGAE
jgi:hypothetical protein